MRQARANVSRVLPLSPLVATALVGIAALLAARLLRPSPPPRTQVLQWGARASPLGWFLLGLLVGPGLGFLDRALLDAGAPIIACAVGWVAARAGAELGIRERAEWSVTSTLEAAGAVLVPAALLVVAAQGQLTPSSQEWKLIGPIVATLAAAVALAGTANPRRAAAGSIGLATVALAALLLPHARGADLRRLAIWLACAGGGAILCAGLATRLARRQSPVPATIAALCLAAGIGMVSGSSPVVVCALMGFGLARWSAVHVRLAAELEIHEATVSAVLWTTAGAGVDGPLVTVALAAVLVALWPLGRRIVTGVTPVNSTLGLAIAMNFMLVAGPGATLARVVPTIAGLGLLPRAPERLTSAVRRIEVSA